MTGRRHILAGVLTAVLLGTGVGTARAGTGYDARLWYPIYDGSGLFTSYGTGTIKPGRFRIGATLDYASSPIVLRATGGGFAPVVTSATTFEIGAGVGIHDRIDASVALPIQTHTILNPYGSDRQGGITANGLGDARLAGKVRILAPKDAVPGVAVALEFVIPSGEGRSWLGSGAFQPALFAVAQENVGPVALFANAGYRLRPQNAEIWGTFVDDAFVYRAGGRYDIGFQKFRVLGEVSGLVGTGGGPSPAEVGLGVQRPITDDIGLAIGGNVGLTEALGAPEWRVYAAFNWELGKRRGTPTVPATIATPPDPEPEPVEPLATHVEPEPEPEPVEPAEPMSTPAPVANPVVPTATVKEKIIELNQKIHFKHNSARLSEASNPILNAVATTLREHPELTRISIEGHTDSTGTAVFNRVLSIRRARAVRRYLIEQGVDGPRLHATGFGEARPIASNRSKDGRLENRRVEFKIVERKGQPAEPPPEEDAPEPPSDGDAPDGAP